MKPLRTLLFSTLYPSAMRPLHGIFVETRLRELLKTGQVETRVIAPVPWFPFRHERFGERARMARTPAREQRHGIDVLHPRYPLLPKLGMSTAPLALAAACIRPIQKLIDSGFDFDVIDAHYYYPDGVAAAILARHFRKPLTITARGTDLNLIPQHALPRRMIRWAAGQADASIGVCAALVDVLKGWGIAPHKLHVMRNGVDLQRFAPRPMAGMRQRLGMGTGPVLLSVGHLVERKGHHLCIDAMPQLLLRHPLAHLYVIGEGEERQRLQAQVQTLNLGAAVTLTGALPNDSLADWYSAADALILASSREGWANVLLEAMACGAPVVATRIWGTPEVVANTDVGLLVDERSGPALAAALLQVLAVPRDRQTIRRYAEGFGWAETSDKQVAVFRKVSTLRGAHA